MPIGPAPYIPLRPPPVGGTVFPQPYILGQGSYAPPASFPQLNGSFYPPSFTPTTNLGGGLLPALPEPAFPGGIPELGVIPRATNAPINFAPPGGVGTFENLYSGATRAGSGWRGMPLTSGGGAVGEGLAGLRALPSTIRGLGWKGVAKGVGGGVVAPAIAQAIANNARAGAFSGQGVFGIGAGKTLDNSGSAQRLAQSSTSGMIAGIPFGAPGVAVGAAGVGLGQAGINAMHNLDPNTGIEYLNESWYNPMRYVHEIGNGMAQTFNGLEGNELNPMYVAGRAITGNDPATEQQAAVDQQARARDEAVTAVNNQSSMYDAAVRFNMPEEAAKKFQAEWNDNVAAVMDKARRGTLTRPSTNDQGEFIDAKGVVVDGPDKAAQVKVSVDEAPMLLHAQMNQVLDQLPDQAHAARDQYETARHNEYLAQRQAESAAAVQHQREQQMLADAFGWSLAMNNMIGPRYAAMSADPALAPYVPMIQAGMQQMPFNALRQSNYKDLVAADAERTRQMNALAARQSQEPQTPDEAYQLAYARASAEAKAKAEFGQ